MKFIFTCSVFLLTLFSLSCLQALELREAKAAYFRPTDKRFRKIYNNGGGIYGIELSEKTWKDLYIWGSASYFTKSGHSLGSKDSTRIQFIPIGIGLKYLFDLKYVDLYVGAGPLATYLNIKNDYPYVVRKEHKWGYGGIFKGGLLINLGKIVFIDLFGDYSLMEVHFHDTHHGKISRHNAHLSGWSAGGGIGVRI